MSAAERAAKAGRMESVIREYADACNEADAKRTRSCFTADAVHYFPPGMYGGPFVGAAMIAEKWRWAVRELGSYWTIDQMAIDPARDIAVCEWTHFKTKDRKVLRGSDWFVFDRTTGLIKEVRAYYASPQAAELERLELDGFDYAGRGYPSSAPPGVRR